VVDDMNSHTSQSVEKTYNGKTTKITLVNNPSHLEAQNSVSMGKTRSKMVNHTKDDVLNVQVHGDAAFCAQGIVYESLLLGRVPNFSVNGTIHIITNNQIGYTTNPIDGRSSKYSSDIGKAFNIPIIHVNSFNV
jgi:2-oxoglutarate dehydrogenase complex dehydrogenase (E1) component-like enzyme